VEQQRADGVGVLVEEPVKLLDGHASDRSGHGLTHPRKLRDEGPYLRCVSLARAEDVGKFRGCGIRRGSVGRDGKGGGGQRSGGESGGAQEGASGGGDHEKKVSMGCPRSR